MCDGKYKTLLRKGSEKSRNWKLSCVREWEGLPLLKLPYHSFKAISVKMVSVVPETANLQFMKKHKRAKLSLNEKKKARTSCICNFPQLQPMDSQCRHQKGISMASRKIETTLIKITKTLPGRRIASTSTYSSKLTID